MGGEDSAGMSVEFGGSKQIIASELGMSGDLPIGHIRIRSSEFVETPVIRIVSDPASLFSSSRIVWGAISDEHDTEIEARDIYREVHVNRRYLRAIRERRDCEISVEVLRNGKVLACSETRTVTVHPWGWWRRDVLPALASFVDDQSQWMSGRRRSVAVDLDGRVEHFDHGYLNVQKDVAEVVRSCCVVIRRLGLKESDLLDLGDGWAYIHDFQDLEVSGHASPLELALVLSSLLMNLRLRPVLDLSDPSAPVVAVWTAQMTDDASAPLGERLASGVRDGRVLRIPVTRLFGDAPEIRGIGDVTLSGDMSVSDRLVDPTEVRLRFSRQFPAGVCSQDGDAPAAEGEDAVSPLGSDRFEMWERKLLDTSHGNNLVSLRHSRIRFPLAVSDNRTLLRDLERNVRFTVTADGLGLSIDDAADGYELTDLVAGDDRVSGHLSELYRDRILPAPLAVSNLSDLVKEKAKSVKESGVNPLYLVFNLVRWEERGVTRYAPFLLMHVNLEEVELGRAPGARKVTRRYTLTKLEDAYVNPVFIQKLNNEQGLDIECERYEFDPREPIDLDAVCASFEKYIKEYSGWRIVPAVTLGSFSPTDYTLWSDLHGNEELIRGNPLVGSLIDGVNRIPSGRIEPRGFFEDVRLSFDADGSQMTAINAALNNESFVLHGPPGTGKSQTIANIITNLLSRGKTVLFVAEKPVALKGVQDHLIDIGLDDFCTRIDNDDLEDDSRRVARSVGLTHRVLVKLNTVAKIDSDVDFPTEMYEGGLRQYSELARSFEEYKRDLYSTAYFGRSFRSLVNHYYELGGTLEGGLIDERCLSHYRDTDFLPVLTQLFEGLSLDLKGMDLSDFHLRDCELTQVSTDDLEALKVVVDSFERHVDQLNDDNLIGVVWMDEEERERMFDVLSRFTPEITAEQITFFSSPDSLNLMLNDGRFDILALDRERREMAQFGERLAMIRGCYTPADQDFIGLMERCTGLFDRACALSGGDPLSEIGVGGFDGTREDTLGYWNGLLSGFNPDATRSIADYCERPDGLMFELGNIRECGRYLESRGIRPEFRLNDENVRLVRSVHLTSTPPADCHVDRMISSLLDAPVMLTSPLSDDALELFEEYVRSLDLLVTFIQVPDRVNDVLRSAHLLLDAKRWAVSLETAIHESFWKVGKDVFESADCDAEFRAQTHQGLFDYINSRRMVILGDTTTEGNVSNLSRDLARCKALNSRLSAAGVPESVLDSRDIGRISESVSILEGADGFSHHGRWEELRGGFTRLVEVSESLLGSAPSMVAVEEMHGLIGLLRGILQDESLGFGGVDWLARLSDEVDEMMRGVDRDSDWRVYWRESVLGMDEAQYLDLFRRVADYSSEKPRRRKALSAEFLTTIHQLNDGVTSSERAAEAFLRLNEFRSRLRNLVLHLRSTHLGQMRMAVDRCARYLEAHHGGYEALEGLDRGTLDALVTHTGDLGEYVACIEQVAFDIQSLLDVRPRGWAYGPLTYLASNLVSLFGDIPRIRDLYAKLDEACTNLSSLAVRPEVLSEYMSYLQDLSQVDQLFRRLGAYDTPEMMSAFVSGEMQRSFESICESIRIARFGLTEVRRSFEQAIGDAYQEYSEAKSHLHAASYLFDNEMIEVSEIFRTLEPLGHLVPERFHLLCDLESRVDDFERDLNNIYTSLRLSRPRVTDVESCRRLKSDILHSIRLIPQWVDLQKYKQKFIQNRFSRLYDLIYEGADKDVLRENYIRSLHKHAIETYLENHEVLRDFTASDFETRTGMYTDVSGVDRNGTFPELDSDLIGLNRRHVRATLCRNLSHLRDLETNAQANQLHQEVDGETTGSIVSTTAIPVHRPLRQILGDISKAVRYLAPCMMMNPTSVAKYLDMRKYHFDYIIFDEASQIFTYNAVGAVARADHAIIVGDPCQLPPTSIGESGECRDSILDECIDLNMPNTYLTWHYRSSHESLIDFSNQEFYQGRMSTFPSTDDRSKRVGYTYVPDGFYEGGNEVEARSVVDYLFERLSNETYDREEIGVIAFGGDQRDTIRRVIRGFEKTDPERYGLFQRNAEAIRITSLEDVQGDEFRLVLFSVGYGKSSRCDESGRHVVNLQWGPLTHPTGWRRLNVAITRTKEEMMVFTSISASEMQEKMSRSSKEYATQSSMLRIRRFLEYAEHCQTRVPAPARVSDGTQDNIALAIKEYVDSLPGLACDVSVGQSKFKVDVAVIDTTRDRDRYILGILTDGATFRSTENIRDNSFAQMKILLRLDWNIMRVWTREWWQNSEVIKERIRVKLEEITGRSL